MRECAFILSCMCICNIDNNADDLKFVHCRFQTSDSIQEYLIT